MRRIPPRVVAIHRISNAMVKESPFFTEIAKELLDFIKNGVLVGHNIRKFDIPFLNSELQEAHLPLLNNEIIFV